MNVHDVGRIFPIFLYLKTRALKTRKHLTIRRVYAVPLHRKFTFWNQINFHFSAL